MADSTSVTGDLATMSAAGWVVDDKFTGPIPSGIEAVDRITGESAQIEAVEGSIPVALYARGRTLGTRIMRFDAAADMPADITSAANVAADRIRLDTFDPRAETLQLSFHSVNPVAFSVAVPDGSNAGPICMGVLVCINAADDNDANSRLTYTDLTGAGTSAAGRLNLVMLSVNNPFAEFQLDDPLIRLDVIGIPIGFTPSTIVPAYLEVRVS